MAQYKINIQLDGIEIYFDEKPTDDVLQRLRDNRWRWHRGKHCWYSRISEESLQFANELCKPTHAPKITFPPKSTVAEQTPSDNSAHITYRMISGGETLAYVTISKNGDQYTVSSTNNQLVCSDCRRIFRSMRQAAPFADAQLNIYSNMILTKLLKDSCLNSKWLQKNRERKPKNAFVRSA